MTDLNWTHSGPENGENGVDPEQWKLNGWGLVGPRRCRDWGKGTSQRFPKWLTHTWIKTGPHPSISSVLWGRKLRHWEDLWWSLHNNISGHSGLEPRNPYSWARVLSTKPAHFQVWMEEESITRNRMMALDWMILSRSFSAHKCPGSWSDKFLWPQSLAPISDLIFVQEPVHVLK